MKKLLILTFGFGFGLFCLSCMPSHSEKPTNFLNKTEMTNLLTEIRITEVLLYNEHCQHYNEDSIRLHTQMAYAPIFAKYKITYKDYQANMQYYVGQPLLLEKMLKDVTLNLEKLQKAKP
ncbi:MAG: DUF4296 domain-containing protein [Bacteroidales bacterium]